MQFMIRRNTQSYFTGVTADVFDVDSWRSASTVCPLNWRNGNQQCCDMQRGFSIYRMPSSPQERVFSIRRQKRWKQIALCLHHHLLRSHFLKSNEDWHNNLMRKTFHQLMHILEWTCIFVPQHWVCNYNIYLCIPVECLIYCVDWAKSIVAKFSFYCDIHT